MIPIAKGSVFNRIATANTDLFATALEPEYTPTQFRVHACFSLAGLLTVRRALGATVVSETLNMGANLATASVHMEEILVDSGETINIRYGATATCLKLSVVEIPDIY